MGLEHAGELKRLVSESVKRGVKLEPPVLTKMAELVSKDFAVERDEVAILAVTQQDKFLRFLIPERLKDVGQIPLTSTTALAARTAKERRPELVNFFTAVPHASVFEAVPLTANRSEPIQKIMSAPILLGERVVGVIQISRKARTHADAGPDFTAHELRDLVVVAGTLAPCVPLCAED
jgi:hypothetical protein